MPNLIEIENWELGIADSPHVGFGEMRNVVVDHTKKISKINFTMTKKSGTTILGLPIGIVPEKGSGASRTAYLWTVDYDNGNPYFSADLGDTWSLVTGSGAVGGNSYNSVISWKNYVFATRNTIVDVRGPLSGVAAWTNTWKTFLDSVGGRYPVIPVLVGQDDIVYWGTGQSVVSLSQNAGSTFAPGTGSTFTFTDPALDLPTGTNIRALAELGKNLMIGTFMGGTADRHPVGYIYPWDRLSDSFFLPVEVREPGGIRAMASDGNLLYFFAGLEGKCFVTDGSTARELFRIPQALVNLEGGTDIDVLPNAMSIHGGKILFGIGGDGIVNPAIGANSANFSYDLRTKTLLVENTFSSTPIHIGSIYTATRERYLVGWKNASAQGIDKRDNTIRYTSYGAYIRSPYYVIGTKQKPVPLSEIEVQFENNLATGEGVRLGYRTNMTDAFTTIATIDFATYGAIQSYNTTLGVTVDSGVQFQVEMTTGTSSSTTPELRKIIVR